MTLDDVPDMILLDNNVYKTVKKKSETAVAKVSSETAFSVEFDIFHVLL